MDDSCGQAFPSNAASGMSLRDFFAAHAMIALHCSETRGGRWTGHSAVHCAKNAWELADAMIAEKRATEK